MLIACAFFCNNLLYGQNLIRNASFEIYTAPATWNNWVGDFIDYSVLPAQRILSDWDELGSADYLNSACTHTYAGVPINRFGQSYAKNGNNYAGFEPVYNNSETKEYIYQQLSSPLQPGKLYCLSFFVSRADRIAYAVKSIGAYFSNNVQNTTATGYINALPQVVNQNGFITDTTQWTEIQGCFTANGGEQYITIGNFNSNANTDTLRIQPLNPLSTTTVDIAYYYIDDVTLVDQTTVGVTETIMSSNISIYPNPTSDVLNIDLGFEKENTKINIYNSLGELVLAEQLTTQNSSLKTHHLPSGVYFYHILVGEKTIKTDKIVIIK